MTADILFWPTAVCGALIGYHHVGYPLLLRFATRRRVLRMPAVEPRAYLEQDNDRLLPFIHVIIPAFNEADFVGEKIRNMAVVDYPANRVKISILCDGCTDDTAQIARLTALEPECSHLAVDVVEHRVNRGKVAVINEAILASKAEFVALSDVSALVSFDAFLIAIAHFKLKQVGVVSGCYRFLNPSSAGEEAYWKYQTAIKQQESALGSTLGVHGAFYMLRRELFQPLAPDTINDDFVLPMTIVAQGFKAEYEPRIVAVELEHATVDVEQRRRRRIAAGNAQQVARLWRLLSPRFRGVAFNFASGKTLRVLMPGCLVFFLLGTIALANEYAIFAVALAAQMTVYGLAAYRQAILPREVPKALQTVHYVVSGYVVSLVGILRYMLGLEKGRWTRATISGDKR